MKRQMTYDERFNLGLKFLIGSVTFLILGLVSVVTSWMMTKSDIVALALFGICYFIAGVLGFFSLWVRYHEKKPKWQRDVERSIRSK